MSLRLKHGILLAVGFVLTLATLYVPMLSNNASQMKSILFGYPFKFVTQDFSDYDASFSYFPRYQTVELFKRPIQDFDSFKFLLSWAAVFVTLEAVIYLLEWLKYKVRG